MSPEWSFSGSPQDDRWEPFVVLSSASAPLYQEAQLESDLKVGDFPIDNVAAGFSDLEPFKVINRAGRLSHRVTDGIVDAVFGRPDDFYQFVGVVIRHVPLSFSFSAA